jgi:GlpG protein
MNIKSLPKITSALLAISLYVAFISRLGQNFDALQPYFISWYVDQGLLEVREGQIWRLVSPIFIHFGLMHLAFNLIMIWQLGELLERHFGPTRFLGLVLVLAVISNLAQFYTSGPGFGGLSGVLYGLFGYFWIASRLNPYFGYEINPGAVKMLLIWFVLCWFDFFGLLGDIKVANMAHTGGLVMGMLLAYLGSLNNNARLGAL